MQQKCSWEHGDVFLSVVSKGASTRLLVFAQTNQSVHQLTRLVCVRLAQFAVQHARDVAQVATAQNLPFTDPVK